MDKYTLLIVLNAPLALYGCFNVLLAYKLKKLRPAQAALRMTFWLIVLVGVLLVRPITTYLYNHALTNTTPLSIYDVLLVTGISCCFLLLNAANSRVSKLEDQLTTLHEKLSIILSQPPRK